MTINTQKLHRELEAAGIPIDGVASDGRINFRSEVTDEQRQRALAIQQAHVPEDYLDKRRAAYLEQGITVENLVLALWERMVEGKPEASENLQALREAIHQQFPEEVRSEEI